MRRRFLPSCLAGSHNSLARWLRHRSPSGGFPQHSSTIRRHLTLSVALLSLTTRGAFFLLLDQTTQSTSVFKALITNRLAPIKLIDGGRIESGSGGLEYGPIQTCELSAVVRATRFSQRCGLPPFLRFRAAHFLRSFLAAVLLLIVRRFFIMWSMSGDDAASCGSGSPSVFSHR